MRINVTWKVYLNVFWWKKKIYEVFTRTDKFYKNVKNYLQKQCSIDFNLALLLIIHAIRVLHHHVKIIGISSASANFENFSCKWSMKYFRGHITWKLWHLSNGKWQRVTFIITSHKLSINWHKLTIENLIFRSKNSASRSYIFSLFKPSFVGSIWCKAFSSSLSSFMLPSH